MTLDQTLNDPREFNIFSLALTTLSKSARLLLMGGANQQAIAHINRGIELISKQLNEAAERLEIDLQASRDVDDLFKTLGIAHSPEDPGETKSP